MVKGLSFLNGLLLQSANEAIPAVKYDRQNSHKVGKGLVLVIFERGTIAGHSSLHLVLAKRSIASKFANRSRRWGMV